MPENKDKPTATEIAMEKNCIFLVTAALFAQAMSKDATDPPNVKCRGPACGQYAEFINKCGFAK